jgi:hypothetical protein
VSGLDAAAQAQAFDKLHLPAEDFLFIQVPAALAPRFGFR